MTADGRASDVPHLPGSEPLEWPLSFGRAASLAFAGPGGFGLVGLAMLVTRFGADTSRGWVVVNPVGRALCGAVSLFLLGAAVVILAAGVRRVPVLRLDEDGVSAWNGWRVCHVPWDQVEGFGSIGHVQWSDYMAIEVRGGRPLRIFRRAAGTSLTSIRLSFIEWLDQPGHRGTQNLSDLLDFSPSEPFEDSRRDNSNDPSEEP